MWKRNISRRKKNSCKKYESLKVMTKKVETVDISNDDLLFMLNKIVQKPVTNCWESLDDKLKDSVKSVL